jgi:hypothetical protein
MRIKVINDPGIKKATSIEMALSLKARNGSSYALRRANPIIAMRAAAVKRLI